MEILLILVIRFYWYVFPESKRRKCIFRTSCSQHVYHTAKKEGFRKGLKALRYRFQNCRNGFHIFENPIDGRKSMILQNGQVLTEEEISERFIKRAYQNVLTTPKF
ncbi:membrane protein insertion efficiency factor YidD [Pedobacter cryoconitis]|uniref:membrane protein insertion efficiency factor YidD n=1 Tax=Pedobacter cryoconitis TaxID=188932 RepID=UPI00083825D6